MANERFKKLLALLLGAATVLPAPGALAQVRVVAGEPGLPVVRSFSATVSASPGISPALSPAAPALSAAAAPSAPAASAAPAPAAASAAQASVAPALAVSAAAAERTALVGARGAVAAAADGPSAPASGENAKASADAAFDGAAAPRSAPALSVAGKDSAGAPALGPARSYDPGPRTASLPDRVRDRMRYNSLLSRSFWWYMYTHIKDMWPGYKERWAKASEGGAPAVSRPRAFFTAMRTTGMSGRFYALGGSALEDDLVIAEFRSAFDRYFDGPGVGAREREALERFMARAKGFNAEKRAHTNMYKNIRDPLIKASTMRADQLAGYFDGLLPPEKEAATKEYQLSGKMDVTREAFLQVLRRTLDEEDPNDPKRVRAAVVLGSFASGSAGPGSDFDVEALVDGAANDRLPAFMKRLTDHWTEAGYHQTNPVTVHDNASWPSWGLINIVQTRNYIVVSPEPALVARLSRQAFENPATRLERGYTVRGRVNRVFHRAVVTAATYAADARVALGLKPSSGH